MRKPIISQYLETITILAYAKTTRQPVRYRDLMVRGIQPHVIDNVAKDCQAVFGIDEEGYTIITFLN